MEEYTRLKSSPWLWIIMYNKQQDNFNVQVLYYYKNSNLGPTAEFTNLRQMVSLYINSQS